MCSTPANAETYGAWLGRRYKDSPGIVWILGGDRPFETDTHKDIIRAMARGLRAGVVAAEDAIGHRQSERLAARVVHQAREAPGFFCFLRRALVRGFLEELSGECDGAVGDVGHAGIVFGI